MPVAGAHQNDPLDLPALKETIGKSGHVTRIHDARMGYDDGLDATPECRARRTFQEPVDLRRELFRSCGVPGACKDGSAYILPGGTS